MHSKFWRKDAVGFVQMRTAMQDDKISNFGSNRLCMTRQAIIERAIRAINQLPQDKAEKISDFAEFMMKQYEEQQLTKGIQQLTANSYGLIF